MVQLKPNNISSITGFAILLKTSSCFVDGAKTYSELDIESYDQRILSLEFKIHCQNHRSQIHPSKESSSPHSYIDCTWMEGSHCMTFHLLKRVYSQHKTARSRIKNTENEQLLGYCTHPSIPSTFLHNSGMVKNQSTESITSKLKKKPKCKIWNTFPRITKNREYFDSFPNFYLIIAIPDNAPFSLFFSCFLSSIILIFLLPSSTCIFVLYTSMFHTQSNPLSFRTLYYAELYEIWCKPIEKKSTFQ